MQNQHFVPRSYLKHFTLDGQNLWVIPRGQEPYLRSVADVATRVDLYSPAVERKFSRKEGRFADVVRRVVRGAVEEQRPVPDDEKVRGVIADFVAIQLVRTPRWKAVMVAALRDAAVDAHDDLFDKALTHSYVWTRISAYMRRQTWSLIVTSDDAPFVTCDNPVVGYLGASHRYTEDEVRNRPTSEESVEFAYGTVFGLPLSSRVLLEIHDRKRLQDDLDELHAGGTPVRAKNNLLDHASEIDVPGWTDFFARFWNQLQLDQRAEELYSSRPDPLLGAVTSGEGKFPQDSGS